MLTKALTSCVGFFIGDRIAQTIGGLPFDPFRSLRLSLYGLLLDGPVGHWWYEVLGAPPAPAPVAALAPHPARHCLATSSRASPPLTAPPNPVQTPGSAQALPGAPRPCC